MTVCPSASSPRTFVPTGHSPGHHARYQPFANDAVIGGQPGRAMRTWAIPGPTRPAVVLASDEPYPPNLLDLVRWQRIPLRFAEARAAATARDRPRRVDRHAPAGRRDALRSRVLGLDLPGAAHIDDDQLGFLRKLRERTATCLIDLVNQRAGQRQRARVATARRPPWERSGRTPPRRGWMPPREPPDAPRRECMPDPRGRPCPIMPPCRRSPS